MCINYRALNKVAIKNNYPLPRNDDLFDQYWVEKNLLWKIVGSLATASNDLRVENQLLYLNPRS